jgi:aspartokinase/homoserine dehydrogenase 1
MGGVTNRLIEIGKMAAAGNTEYIEFLKVVEERHFSVVRGLIPVKNQSSTFAAVRGIFNELEDIFRVFPGLKSCPKGHWT